MGYKFKQMDVKSLYIFIHIIIHIYNDTVSVCFNLQSGNELYTHRITGSVQSLSHVRLFVIPWAAAYQASLSIANSQSLLKLLSIELVMPSNHLILCHPLLLLPSTFPSIRIFSSELVLHLWWPTLEFQLQHRSFQ